MQSSRTMMNGSTWKRRAGWAHLASAIAALAAPIAYATETIVDIPMPVVQAGAGSGSAGTVKSLDWMTDELRTLIHADAAVAGASASGHLGIVDVHNAN